LRPRVKGKFFASREKYFYARFVVKRTQLQLQRDAPVDAGGLLLNRAYLPNASRLAHRVESFRCWCQEVEMAEAFGSMAALKNQGLLMPESNTHFRIERNFLVSILSKRLATIKFDEAWYLSKYPDVKDAVRRGVVASGREHYVAQGFYEHRMPVAIQVNEKWYLESYPDIAEAIRAGVYKSAQAHFDQAGFREGRLPYPNFQF